MKKSFLLAICLCFLTTACGCCENHTEIQKTSEKAAVSYPEFFTESMENLHIDKPFSLENCYVTNIVTASSRLYIDGSGNLIGSGTNEFRQLSDAPSYVSGSQFEKKIAENVISADISENNYFSIYLTSDGNLYGIGSNRLGLLGQPYNTMYENDTAYTMVGTPVLLMEDVAYARAGRYSIVALKKDGSVWWWGEYKCTYQTKRHEYPSKAWDDRDNEFKMYAQSPKKMLDNCIYATAGTYVGAAITADGELYTWGSNVFGQCGTEVSYDDDFVRTPVKVLDNVKMVWPGRMSFGYKSSEKPLEDSVEYPFTTFVQKNDGTFMAAGKDVGNKTKTTQVSGDLAQAESHTFSDSFVPITVAEK